MKILHEEELREQAIIEVAKKMMTAARTVPKGKGADNIVVALLKKDSIKEVTYKLKEMAYRNNLPDFFLRDAVNILPADAMVILGTRIKNDGLGSLWYVWFLQLCRKEYASKTSLCF